MASLQSEIKLKRKLRRIILAGGLQGVPQRKCIMDCRTYHSKLGTKGFRVSFIINELLEWNRRGLIDCFDVRASKYQPTRFWRATTALKDTRF